MKLVKYEYIDGQVTPSYIINGGYFYHRVGDKVYLVGVVADDYPTSALTRAELEAIAPTEDGFGRPISASQAVDNFLSMLRDIYNLNVDVEVV